MSIMATGQITILDITDMPSLQGYLASTQPKTQFLNTAGTTYTPSWATTPNTISVELYKIGNANNIVTSAEVKAVRWYKNGTEITVSSGGITLNAAGSGNGLNSSITINVNSLMTSSTPNMKITCEINYSPSAAYDSAPYILKLDMDFFLSVQGATGATGGAGAPAYTVILSNEAQTIACDVNGTPITGELGSTGKAKTDITVYKGSTLLTAVADSATPTTGQFKYVIGTAVNCTAVRTDNDTLYVNTVSADSGSVPITVYLESGTTTVAKIFTWAKAKTGATGADGADGSTGAAGANAQSLDISGAQVFKYDTEGTLVAPASITLTCAKQNITGTITWKYGGNGATPTTTITNTSGQTVISGDTLQIYPTATIWGSFTSLTIEASISTIKDTFTIYKVQDGAVGADSVVYDINATQYVIVKNAPDAATSGVHTNITVTGKRYIGAVSSNFGYLTVTGNGDSEAATATATTITTSIADTAGKTSYTVRLYDAAAKTTLLDTLIIPVVFKGNTGNTGNTGSTGAAGADAITVVLSNEAHTLPVDENDTVTYTGSGTNVYLYEGATAINYDGTGTSNGTFNVTAAVTSGTVTIGSKTDGGAYATFAQHSAMTTDIAVITYTITGKRANGNAISLTKTQTLAKAKSAAALVASLYATSEVFKNANSTDTITLTMDLYKSGTLLTTGVTYLWYKGASSLGITTKTLAVVASDVASLEVYKCVATYNSKTYTDYITIIDITDPYQIEVLSSNGNMFKNTSGTTVLSAIVRRNGLIEDANGTTLLYIWRKVNKDGDPDSVVNKGSQISGITITQASAGTTATLNGTNAAFVAGKYYVFGAEKIARRVQSIVSTTVTFTEATTAPLGTTIAVYAVTNTNTVNVSATDVSEKATFFVDVDTP